MKRYSDCQRLHMSPKLILQEGAILIADAHYSDRHPEFFAFLKAIDSGKIKTKQLILMGDMFELLFGVIQQTQRDNKDEIALLNQLSQKIEIIYFEGNHDFGLKSIFPDVSIFPLEEQPQTAQFNEQTVQLSHGDTQTPLGYRIYTNLIRNRAVLFCVGFLDLLCFHCIIKWLKNRGVQKEPCYRIGTFKDIIQRRLGYLKDKSLDIVIEGHFHQNISFKLYGFDYINLSAFACNHKYFIVQSSKGQLHLQETLFEEL